MNKEIRDITNQSQHCRSTDLSSLYASELAVVSVPGQRVRPQHLMTLLVAHHLIVGLIQGDPHLHVGT